jgi:hypothetical protein
MANSIRCAAKPCGSRQSRASPPISVTYSSTDTLANQAAQVLRGPHRCRRQGSGEPRARYVRRATFVGEDETGAWCAYADGGPATVHEQRHTHEPPRHPSHRPRSASQRLAGPAWQRRPVHCHQARRANLGPAGADRRLAEARSTDACPGRSRPARFGQGSDAAGVRPPVRPPAGRARRWTGRSASPSGR